MTNKKIRIAVFSGATATVQNSVPLVTSNKAREKYGMPPLLNHDGSRPLFDALRPQRLAAPVKVYVKQFSAHPLEADAADLYGPPDGYVDASGAFHTARRSDADTPVYEITLRPEDGLYPLPYMARQADGKPWDDIGAHPRAPVEKTRQIFYPDASRVVEEIDRFGLGEDGLPNMLSSKAEFDFYRPAPSGGYQKGLNAALRTDAGEGDIAPEIWGKDFWPYRPPHLRAEPPRARLAVITNMVQQAMASARYSGAIWLEGSPNVEESIYWLNLLIDVTVPLCGTSSQRPHGALSNDGDRNIVDSVDYILSGIWKGADGKDTIGAVAVLDELIYHAREVQKGDARPGGYVATGGHGGIVGTIGQPGPPMLTFRPARLHTHLSLVRLALLPASVRGVHRTPKGIETVEVGVKDAQGNLLGSAIPQVSMVKSGRYLPESEGETPESEVDILARIERNLQTAPLAGFVGEGMAPYGGLTRSMDAALERAVLSGMPVVKVGRGNAEGMVPITPGTLFIAGSNLTASKARLLLMVCLLKFGALPAASDPAHPAAAERAAVQKKVAQYQEIFNTH